MTPNIYCNADAPILELPIGMVQYIYIEESPCTLLRSYHLHLYLDLRGTFKYYWTIRTVKEQDVIYLLRLYALFNHKYEAHLTCMSLRDRWRNEVYIFNKWIYIHEPENDRHAKLPTSRIFNIIPYCVWPASRLLTRKRWGSKHPSSFLLSFFLSQFFFSLIN